MVRGRLALAPLVATLVLCVPSAAGGILISGFAADLPGGSFDDAVELTNPDNEPFSSDTLRIEDGEGRWVLPAGFALGPGQRVVIVGNATGWQRATDAPYHFVATPPPASSSDVERQGSFRLARDGDQIALWDDTRLLDIVVYADAEPAGDWAGPTVQLRGSPFLRWYPRQSDQNGTLLDSGGAADWDTPHPTFLGASAHPIVRHDVSGIVIGYAAPDASRSTFSSFVSAAQRSLVVNVYQVLDAEIVEAMAKRASEGVDVRLLVDSEPVGFEAEERRIRESLLATLTDAGGRANESQHYRIGYNHAKYAIADGDRVLVQSENLVGTGIPSDREHGNRGWGIVVEDARLAAYMSGVFERDWGLDDFQARAWRPSGPDQEPWVGPGPMVGRPAFAPEGFNGPHAITPVLAPDHTTGFDDPVLGLLAAATDSIRVAQLNAPTQWKDRSGGQWDNDYLEALVSAARRGVRVQVLLDGHFSDQDPDSGDNPDTVDYLNGLGIPGLTARLWVDGAFGVLHVKGVVVDEEAVLVGSMNWNLNSVARNREVSLLIESTGPASYFARIFDSDWESTVPSDPMVVDAIDAPMALIVAAGALALLARGARRRGAA